MVGDLKMRVLKKIKGVIDNYFLKHQDRFSTYLYYTGFLAVNRRFISTIEYMYLTTNWARTLPRKFDAVIGIPREGMIAAYIIGIEHGIPVASLDTFLNNSFHKPSQIKTDKEYKNILLVDEVVDTGKSMERAQAQLLNIDPTLKISKATTFINPRRIKDVDYYFDIKTNAMLLDLDSPDSPISHTLCTDLDGVLCEDTPARMSENEQINFWKNAKPYRIPVYKIPTIVTGRHEKYRKLTEKWLKKNNVKYQRLIMAQEGETPLDTKIGVIRRFKPGLFQESDILQSELIHLSTGCRVLCTKNHYLYGGKQFDYSKGKYEEIKKQVL
jgi:hypoxanthine phosphoribosyltransferase